MSGLFGKPAPPVPPAAPKTPRETEELRLWTIYKQMAKEGRVAAQGWSEWKEKQMAEWVEPGDVDTDGEDV
jgi:hypothetical protein